MQTRLQKKIDGKGNEELDLRKPKSSQDDPLPGTKDGLEDSKKIISNRPNAESLNSHHDRKSSAVVRDIISGKSSKSRD